MSKYKYEFWVGVGFTKGACRSEEIDLVDDYNYEEEELDAMLPEELEEIVYELAEEWHHEYVEYWVERLDG